jgi:hypothetical protein
MHSLRLRTFNQQEPRCPLRSEAAGTHEKGDRCENSLQGCWLVSEALDREVNLSILKELLWLFVTQSNAPAARIVLDFIRKERAMSDSRLTATTKLLNHERFLERP